VAQVTAKGLRQGGLIKKKKLLGKEKGKLRGGGKEIGGKNTQGW